MLYLCCSIKVTPPSEKEINENFRRIKLEYEEKMRNLPEPKPIDPDFLAYKAKIIRTIMGRGLGHKI
jgi:hypothetical protein